MVEEEEQVEGKEMAGEVIEPENEVAMGVAGEGADIDWWWRRSRWRRKMKRQCREVEKE